MKKIDTEGEHRLPVSIFFSQSFSAANFSKYGANSSFSYAYPAMNTQSIKSRVISGSSCSARMHFHSSFACWLSSVSSRFRSSKRPSSVRFKSSGRKSEVRPQGDGQAVQSGAMMAFCLWICSTRSLEAEAESGLPGVTDERAAKRTGAVPSGISFASAARASPMRAQMTASCSGVRPEVFVVVERDISVTFLNIKMSIQYLRSYKEKSIPDRLCRWDFPEELAGTRSYFKIRPSVPIVYTCHGINFPLAISAFFTAASIPPQHGTSMRTTVTLWISLLRMISVSFSE